jgi:putative ABC transport system ATP-binding protein
VPAALFELDDVTVAVGAARLLDGLDLAIADGGVTVIAGPSGAGKSTLLRLLNRLEVPTSGCVRFRGDDIAGLDPLRLRRRVGMVFQRPAPFPGTVRDNLLVARSDAADEDLRDALDRAGLGAEFLDRAADDLSGGEAQRACLARTLVTGPEVLLLDEPTSALDPVSAKGFEAQARRLAGAGVPLVWVSHDLGQAERVADELVVLVGGRLADEHQRRHFLAGEPSDHGHEVGE